MGRFVGKQADGYETRIGRLLPGYELQIGRAHV